ncbi:helix-turn-helix domain-containing protein [Streptomyces sp. AP-93]|uniref:helix-turn-helix domain-containing protein n=1 Tax=Streptomyces sp. AP-93 TaxID=2929048 RepID=UPI001FAEFCB9|nr:helix-turn-helix domain-containing protein [Streptomyces sp. AP-93]MCJ0875587.1 helix-turn-helix domain-containing protein [Streptomyces sp. AP-93]
MSDTTPDGTRTLHVAPNPEPVNGLTGAPAALYTELAGLTEPATVAELALAAGLGRSTTGKALVTLEERGLAVRIPGGHDGPRRTPDRWHPAPATEATNGDEPSQPHADAQPETRPENTPEPDTNDTDTPAGSTETEPDTTAEPCDPAEAPPTLPTTDTPQVSPPQETEPAAGDDDEEDPNGEDSHDGPEATPAPQADAGRAAQPAEPIPLPGEKKRLAPGALRQMVIDHLQAHPGEAFTATKISRVIEKSSGAIANALVTLTRQGIAEQVSDRPRTYQLTAAEAGPE